jgi:cytochrome P450
MISPVDPFTDDHRLGFEPLDADYHADPYPTLARLREATPTFYHAGLDHWVVTRYCDVRHALQTPTEYSAGNALDPLTPLCPHARRILRDGDYAAVPVLTNVDPPAHARQRRLSNVAFTPKRIVLLEPFVRELTRRFCDEHFRDGRADMIADLAWALPALVLFRILGLPDSDLQRVKAGARARGRVIFGHPSDDEQVDAAHDLVAFWHYAWALVEERRARGSDDFIGALAQAENGDEAFTRAELTSLMLSMLFAGHETTTVLLGDAFVHLLGDRPSWDAICAEPDLIPNAIEEVLRYDVALGWRQRTKEAVEIGGITVPARAKLLLLLGSANRDPAVFAQPERFDVRRPNAREHLTFGCGPHTCLGAPLARLEARVVLEEVSGRFPGLRLTAGARLNYVPNITLRVPMSVPVTWQLI